MRSVISKQSGHYKYYRFLLKIWGLDKVFADDPKSLCSYTQEIFWFSVMSVALFPLVLLGWMLLKLHRVIYSSLNKTKIGKKIVDFFDGAFEWGDFIYVQSDGISNSPMLTSILVGMILTIFMFTMALVVLILTLGMGAIVINIAKVPYYTWLVLNYIFALIFYVGSYIGTCLYWIGKFFAMIGSGIALHIGIIGTVCAWALGIGIGALILSYIIIKIMRSDFMASFRAYLSFKFNGFQEARESARERREKVVRDAPPRKPSWISRVWHFLFGKIDRDGEEKIKILGCFSLIWQAIVAIKKGICPLTEFIDENEKKE